MSQAAVFVHVSLGEHAIAFVVAAILPLVGIVELLVSTTARPAARRVVGLGLELLEEASKT